MVSCCQRKTKAWSYVKSPLAQHEISIYLTSPKGLVVFCQWMVGGRTLVSLKPLTMKCMAVNLSTEG